MANDLEAQLYSALNRYDGRKDEESDYRRDPGEPHHLQSHISLDSGMISQAFFQVCDQHVHRNERYVTLYQREPYYGGPEEGGWWGSDTVMIATHSYPLESEAQAAKERVEQLCIGLRADAKREHGDKCKRELDWCEDRGLEPDYLPEVSGETDYFVAVEETPGSGESRGCRYYE
jgi:hypothetical protein